jgi:hypothetical protein
MDRFLSTILTFPRRCDTIAIPFFSERIGGVMKAVEYYTIDGLATEQEIKTFPLMAARENRGDEGFINCDLSTASLRLREKLISNLTEGNI